MQIIIQHHIFVLALKERKTTDILQIKIERVPQSSSTVHQLTKCDPLWDAEDPHSILRI